MPSSLVRTFSDPDAFSVARRGASGKLILTGRGVFRSDLTQINLHDIWMQRVRETLPRIMTDVRLPGRVCIGFHVRPSPVYLWCGLEIGPNDLLSFSDVPDYYTRVTGASEVGSISLPLDQIGSASAAIVGRELVPPRDGLVLRAMKTPLARLRALHERAACLARAAPSILADTEVARGIEQSCIEAMIECLAVERSEPDRTAVGRHQLIMRRFFAFVEANAERALYLSETCTAIGTTERTLRRCCQEQLGFGPKHYLLLRRMHLARRALRHADPANATVASIAARFGFWDFGRFAAAYRDLFGEAPSVTLRHPGQARWYETENAGEFLAEIT